MLDESLDRCDEINIGNVENNNPMPLLSSGDGLKMVSSKPRQAMLKKGGRKLRSTAPCPQRALHHQKTQRSSPISRLSDHNNNLSGTAGNKAAAQPCSGLPAASQTLSTLHHHHIKQGSKKELLKSKGVRLERGNAQPGTQPACSLGRHDQMPQNVNLRSHRGKPIQAPVASKKKDHSSQAKAALREQKKPLHASDNVKILNVPPAEAAPEDLKDGEKVYAGAKFSEPPSPSVLPKPPSHWVGENEPQHSSQSPEQMTVHLKSLLKVQDTS